jgi:lipid A ethanolaminephosphotransferase
MVINFFETSSRETASYFNLSAVIQVTLLLIVPFLLLALVHIKYSNPITHMLRWFRCIVVCIALVVASVGTFYSDYASFFRNNNHVRSIIIPSSILRYSFRYVRDEYLLPTPIHREIGLDAKQKTVGNQKVIVMVLGETARGVSYPENQYARNTTPHTEAFNMIRLKNVTSCGTATTISLPCMFSNLNRENFDKTIALSQDNVLDIAKRAKFDVTWIENSDGCKSVCKRIETIIIPTDSVDPLCDGTYCYDETLILQLEKQLKTASESGRDSLIVLHVIGSHGPTYFRRYPDDHRRFTPDCQRSDIQNCTKEELVNTYDNTIAYTDFIVASAIKKLSSINAETTLAYISDHGESLGEKGIYLHGLPYSIAPIEQISIPWQIWSSNEATVDNRTECLKDNHNASAYSHDNLFHTLLGIAQISTKEYNAKLDILNQC